MQVRRAPSTIHRVIGSALWDVNVDEKMREEGGKGRRTPWSLLKGETDAVNGHGMDGEECREGGSRENDARCDNGGVSAGNGCERKGQARREAPDEHLI